MKGIRFVYGEPALIHGEWLVVSDLHIGYGGASPVFMGRALSDLLEEWNISKLLIVGDLKDNILRDEGEVRLFLDQLSSYEVHLCKGNHDGGIERYEDVMTIHPPSGVVIDGVGFVHGHAWPSEDVSSQPFMIMGHQHPILRFGNLVRKVWARVRLDLRERYGREVDALIMPAYSPSVWGTDVCSMNLGPLLSPNIFIKSSLKIYQLNGVEVGGCLSGKGR